MPGSDANVLFDLWLASRAATRAIDDVIRDSGLTADEFAVYSVLASGPRTPSALAGALSAPPTTVSSYVRRFEGRGHVRREPHPDDGRSYRLALTPEGERAHRAAGAAFLHLLAAVRRDLGDERPVRDALERLRLAVTGGRSAPDGSGAPHRAAAG